MLSLLISWLIVTGAILLAAYVIPGVRVRSVGSAAVAAAILGIVNLILKPIALFFAFPFIVITLGLFIFVVNALLFWLAAAVAPGLDVKNFWSALLGALIVSIVSYITNAAF
ncbi:MAG: phage holin family protein [Desulfomonilaceae bacterium]|nr:phage holin family protein [Desulfomonilaceae bacterium]